jgi:hypothetical protein
VLDTRSVVGVWGHRWTWQVRCPPRMALAFHAEEQEYVQAHRRISLLLSFLPSKPTSLFDEPELQAFMVLLKMAVKPLTFDGPVHAMAREGVGL